MNTSPSAVGVEVSRGTLKRPRAPGIATNRESKTWRRGICCVLGFVVSSGAAGPPPDSASSSTSVRPTATEDPGSAQTQLPPTSPADWSFASRRGDLNAALPREQATLELSGGQLVATAVSSEQPIHLVFRRRLEGDFELKVRIEFPARVKRGAKLTGAGFLGFRSDVASVEQLCPLSAVGSAGGTHLITVSRVGGRLKFQLDRSALPTASDRVETPGYFVVQLQAPTTLRVAGLSVQGGGAAAPLVQDAKPSPAGAPGMVRTAGKWGLKTSGDATRDQLLYRDVRLEQDAKGVRLSKSLASQEVELVYLDPLADDCLAKFLLELPKPPAGGGRFPDVRIVVAPSKGPGEMLELSLARSGGEGQVQIQKSGELVVARVEGTAAAALQKTVRITPPLRISVKANGQVDLRIAGPEFARFAGSPTTVLAAPEPSEAIELPGVVEDTAVAAGGDFWLLHFRSLRKVGLFDVAQGEISRYLPLDDPQAVIAGGGEQVFVLSPAAGEVVRYRLPDLQREASRKLPFGQIRAAALGFASHGPLLVADERGLRLLDAESLQALPNGIGMPGGTIDVGGLSASADSGFFGLNGRGLATLLAYTPGAAATAVQSGGQLIVPSPLGQMMHGDLPRAANLEPARLDGLPLGLPTLPATREPFFLSVYTPTRSWVPDASGMVVSIHAAPQSRPLASWPVVDAPAESPAGRLGKPALLPYKRFLFHPPAGTMLAVSRDAKLILRQRFELGRLLDGSAIDVPLVISLPSFQAAPGTEYRYPLRAWSRHGQLQTELQSGPEGMTVTPSGEVTWTPSADSGGKAESLLFRVRDAAGRQTFHAFTVRVAGAGGRAAAAVPSAAPPAPAADSPLIRVKLPGAFERIVPCGGGRWLALHFRSLGKIAVVDLLEARIAGYADAKTDGPLLAGTSQALYVVDAASREIQHWALPAVTRTWRRKLPDGIEPLLIAAGSDSSGPLLILDRQGERHLLDPATLKPVPIRSTETRRGLGPSPIRSVRASADGRTFAVLKFSMSGAVSYLLTQTAAGGYDAAPVTFAGSQGIPNADGSRLYTQFGIVATAGQQPITAIDPANPPYLVPAQQGPFFVRFRGDDSGIGPAVPAEPALELLLEDQERPLAVFPCATVFEGALIRTEGSVSDSGGFPADPGERIVALPFDGTLAVLPRQNDTVFIRRFHLDEVLREAAVDYLFVASRPPAGARRGTKYEYAIKAKSSSADVRYSLDSGPPGATISPAGVLTWDVPEAGESERYVVIVSLTAGADRRCFHTFSVEVAGSTEGSAKPAAGEFRMWTEHATGRQVDARVTGFVDGTVHLERRDGQRFALPITRFCDEDQTRIRAAFQTE